MNASGCLSSNKSQLERLATSECDFVVSKSATITQQIGNPKPRLYIDTAVCINAMGLPNLGFDEYKDITLNKPYMLSIYPLKLEHMDVLLTDTAVHVIEVNLSCPNINRNIRNYIDYFAKISEKKGNKKVGVKLPPLFYAQEFDEFTYLIKKYEIDFIVCCNNIPNCLVIKENESVLYANQGLGGMSYKPLFLANVYQFYKRLGSDVPIIGCGGIVSGQDVYDYLLCGAQAVQIGTTLLREGPECFLRIKTEFDKLLGDRKKEDIIGKLKTKSKL